MSIGLAGALIGGLLMLLSPCSVMLLPAFFSYAFADVRTLLVRTGFFYLGLITILVPLGVLAGSVGGAIAANRVLFMTIAAVVVIALGVVQIAGVPLPAFARTDGNTGSTNATVYVLGTVYGFAGACAGPVLGTVLTLTAFGGNALYGGIILLVFAAGMVIPLAVLAVLWGRFDRLREWMRPRMLRIGRWSNSWTQIVGGALMVGIGMFLIASEGTTALPSLLGASQQVRLEGEVMATTAAVSDVVVVAVALAVIAVVVSVHVIRRARRARQR